MDVYDPNIKLPNPSEESAAGAALSPELAAQPAASPAENVL